MLGLTSIAEIPGAMEILAEEVYDVYP